MIGEKTEKTLAKVIGMKPRRKLDRAFANVIETGAKRFMLEFIKEYRRREASGMLGPTDHYFMGVVISHTSGIGPAQRYLGLAKKTADPLVYEQLHEEFYHHVNRSGFGSYTNRAGYIQFQRSPENY